MKHHALFFSKDKSNFASRLRVKRLLTENLVASIPIMGNDTFVNEHQLS